MDMFVIVFVMVLVYLSTMNLYHVDREEAKYTKTVVEVTTANAYDFLSTRKDHSGILLEFYAPWCGHCQTIKPAFEQLGRELSSDGMYRVGKCDISQNAAMTGRFEIREVPTIYFIDKMNVYKYNGPLNAAAIKEFVYTGHMKYTALGLLSNPLGPIGASKGFLIHLGYKVIDLIPRMATYLSISETAAMMLVGVLSSMLVLTVTIVVIFLSFEHAKVD